MQIIWEKHFQHEMHVSPKLFKKLLSNLDVKTICVIQHITQLGSSLHLMGSLHAIRSW